MPSSNSGVLATGKTDFTRTAGDGIQPDNNPTTAKKSKKIAPQDAIDEFWRKFYSTTPGKGAYATTDPDCL